MIRFCWESLLFHERRIHMTSYAQRRTLKEDVRAWWPAALAGLAGLIVLIPVWLKSYVPYGYDSLFHLFSLVSLDQRIAAGDVYPLRFPGFAYGYGWAEPSYYPPLSPYFLELLHLLGANYVIAYKLGMTLMVVGAALSSYALGAALFNRYAGVVTAIIYVFNPYFLSLISPRGALAEMLGLAVAPLVFLAIYRTANAPGWHTYLAISLTVALMILAHPLSTFLFAPFILAFAVAVLVSADPAQRGRVLGVLVAGAFTGALLSCFYWLPARLEPGGLRVFDFSAVRALFLGDFKPLHQILGFGWFGASSNKYPAATFSAALLALAILSLLCFVITWRRRGAVGRVWLFFFVGCTLVDIWLMSKYAVPLWQRIPLAVFVQFPFRWLGPLALFAALMIGGGFAALGPDRLGRTIQVAVPILLLASMVTASADWKVDPMMLASAGVAQVTAADIHDGALLAFEHDIAYSQATIEKCWIWAYEYVPSSSTLSDCRTFVDTVLNDTPVRSTLPPMQARIFPTLADANRLEAQVASPAPWVLSLHAFWIPGWSATIDGKPARTAPTDAIGVVGVEVPAGAHRVRLAFGPTPLRMAVRVISLLALAAWLGMAWWRHRRLATMVSLALLISVGLVGGQALRAPAAPAVQPLDVDLGNKIGLQGFALDQTDDTLAVHLVWLARESMEESYKVFIHVIDDQGKLLAQTDSRPQSYASNTNRWIPGQVIVDRFEVPLPSDAPPGRYQVRVGLYNEADGQRLPVLDAMGKAIDGQVLLGYLDLP